MALLQEGLCLENKGKEKHQEEDVEETVSFQEDDLGYSDSLRLQSAHIISDFFYVFKYVCAEGLSLPKVYISSLTESTWQAGQMERFLKSVGFISDTHLVKSKQKVFVKGRQDLEGDWMNFPSHSSRPIRFL